MSTSKLFDKVAIILICLALILSLALALTWNSVESSQVMTVSKNDLAEITQSIDLDDESGEVSILAGGTYYITGTLEDGRIVVDVDDTERVLLILAGVNISCSDDSAIDVENSGNCAIYLADGTENVITSGTECEITKNSSGDNSGGAILLKDNATICGEGSLTVYGYLNNGIHCSNELYIESGTITVTAVNNGIKGKDLLTVDGGDITVAAGNAGLKSGKSGDSDSGAIVINDGTINVTQSTEGFEANQITVNGGDTRIVSSDDGMNACGESSSFGGGMGGFQNAFGGSHGNDSSGRADAPASTESGEDSVDTESMPSMPDSSAAPNMPEMPDASGMPEMPEGAEMPDASGAPDMPEMPDASGMPEMPDASGMPEMPDGSGTESFDFRDFDPEAAFSKSESESESSTDDEEASALPSLTINGGTVYVLAGGDGLDSNGDLIINGGTIIVDGPSDSANGALDSGSENGGTLLVNGGTLIAVGASGMAEIPESSSAQNVISYNASFSAGDRIAISDADGNVIFEYAAAKSGNSIVFSSPELTVGETYTISVGDDSYELQLSETVTSAGNASGMSFDKAGNEGNFDPSGTTDGSASSGMHGGHGGMGAGSRPGRQNTDTEAPAETAEQ